MVDKVSQDFITKKFRKHRVNDGINTTSSSELCRPPDQFNLQTPQKFLPEFLSPSTPYKGVLVYHKIGSGKTCASIRIAEKWKHKRNIIVVVPAFLVGNYIDELRSPCGGGYLTDKERSMLADPSVGALEKKNILRESDQRIKKFYKIFSYHGFCNTRVPLINSVLIIDEVQNVVSSEGKFYQTILRRIQSQPNLRVVIMSATPISDSPQEIALTMNLLPLPQKMPVGQAFIDTFVDEENGKIKNSDLFRKLIKGFVSYYAGMPAKTFPKYHMNLVACRMSAYQTSCYNYVVDQESRNVVRQLKLPNDFFMGSRIISNMAPPGFRKIGSRAFKDEISTTMYKNLATYSTKFDRLIRKLRGVSKALIYSNFLTRGGIKDIQAVLEHHGYTNYKNEAKTLGKKNKYYAVWSGKETRAAKDALKKAYNDRHSGLCVLLGTPAIREGVSLKRTQQVHIMEPYWNVSRIKQVIGRAVRYCSHADLPRKDQKVDVFLYVAVRPDEASYRHETEPLKKMSIDRHIIEIAKSKTHLVEGFEKLMQESAVDCQLNKPLNRVSCKN
jgi:hypothetical protein